MLTFTYIICGKTNNKNKAKDLFWNVLKGGRNNSPDFKFDKRNTTIYKLKSKTKKWISQSIPSPQFLYNYFLTFFLTDEDNNGNKYGYCYPNEAFQNPFTQYHYINLEYSDDSNSKNIIPILLSEPNTKDLQEDWIGYLNR